MKWIYAGFVVVVSIAVVWVSVAYSPGPDNDFTIIDAEVTDIVFSDTDYDFSFKDGCEIMIELIHENHRFFEERGFVVTGDKWSAKIHPTDAPDGYSAIEFTIDKPELDFDGINITLEIADAATVAAVAAVDTTDTAWATEGLIDIESYTATYIKTITKEELGEKEWKRPCREVWLGNETRVLCIDEHDRDHYIGFGKWIVRDPDELVKE